MEYFIKASIVITLFYICYKLFLQKETFFQSNRWFLLIGLGIAIAFPFVVIPEYIIIDPLNISQESSFIETPITTDLSIIKEETFFSYRTLLPILYGIGVVFFFIRFLLQFGSLILLLIKNPKNKEGIYTYIIVKNDISPFSFFKWIVYNPEQFNSNELQLILNHERVHVRQYHSIDIIITQLVSVVFWCNPFIWLYKKDMQQNLEYIADNKSQIINNDEKIYQKLLLKTSITNYDTALTNNFYNSLIKKRIVMLHKSKSKAIKQWKIAIILPLLTILLMSVNKEKVFIEKENTLVSNVEKRETLEFIVTKNTTNAELNDMIRMVEAKGGTLKFSQVVRNSQNELTGIFVSFYNHSYGGGSQKTPIDSFIIYKELFGNEGGFVGRTGGATMHFKDYDKATNKSIKKLQSRAGKAIIKSGIQNQNDLKESLKKVYSLKSLNSKTIEVVFTKNTTEESFKKHQEWLKENNVSFNINQLERNDKGEISTINIDFTTKKGTVNHSISNSGGIPINSFRFYIKDNGEFGVKNVSSYNEQGHLETDSVMIDNIKNIIQKNNKSDHINASEISNNARLNFSQNKLPLYILDGEASDHETFEKLRNEDIQTINVLKGNVAIDIYGEEAKHGVVVIRTKKNTSPIYILNEKIITETQAKKLETTNSIKNLVVIHHKKELIKEKYGISTDGDVIIIETKEDKTIDDIINNRKAKIIDTKKDTLKSLYGKTTKGTLISKVLKDDNGKNFNKFYIDKNASNKTLNTQKWQLKEETEANVSFSKIKRNSDNEIIKIKISIKDKNGSAVSATWENGNSPIPTIEFGKNSNGVFARTKQ